MTRLQKTLCEASAPPSNESADVWIEREVEMVGDAEIKGRISMRWIPPQRFVIKAYQNPGVRRITALVSTQSGKTTAALLCLVWKTMNRPSSTGWYSDTSGSAKTDAKTKLKPFFESCNVLSDQLPSRREEWTNELIQFASMNLYILGAEAKRNRERITLVEVFIDEARNLAPGALSEIEGRFKTVRNFKRFMFSTAGRVFYNENGEPLGDEFFMAFWRGTRHQFFWPCPHCGHRQTFRFGRKRSPLYPLPREQGGFVLEVGGKVVPLKHFEMRDDVYDLAGIEAATRYECESCCARFKNEDKFALIDAMSKLPDGGAVQTNPMAAADDISVHWWEAMMPWEQCTWGKIFAKFVQALVAQKHGNIAPMRVFVTDSLGEPWEEEQGGRADESEILQRCGNYSLGEIEDGDNEFTITKDAAGKVTWAPAQLLTVDVQHGWCEVLHRIYGRTGRSLLVETTAISTFDEVRAYQKSKGIQDTGVGIDSAFRQSEVFEICLRHGRWVFPSVGTTEEKIKYAQWFGWLPMLGADKDEFMEDGVRKFTKRDRIDANIGKAGGPRYVQRLSFSKPHFNSLLFTYALRGKLAGWTLPKNIMDARPDYVRQMGNTELKRDTDAMGQVIGHSWFERGRHDKSDAEKMQLALCSFRNVKSMDGIVQPEEKSITK